MRLGKFLFTAFLFTFFALLYVWQQNKTVSLAYESQRKSVRFQELLDENSLLRYNLKKDTSLVKLGAGISSSKEFEMPNSYCLVKLNRADENARFVKNSSLRLMALASRFLGIKRQAEAKTVSSIITFRSE